MIRADLRFGTFLTICLSVSFYAYISLNVHADTVSYYEVEALIEQGNVYAIESKGPEVMPVLAQIYESSDEGTKILIAGFFYQMGLESTEAKEALLKDIKTQNNDLRIRVQYALGRVSDDGDVVEALLNNMVNDKNAYFRDKSACALAYDQVHLSEPEKVRLYEGVIEALNDPKQQVRDIAIRVLEIHTGQRKGFNPNGEARDRVYAIKVWKRWLEEYKENL